MHDSRSIKALVASSRINNVLLTMGVLVGVGNDCFRSGVSLLLERSSDAIRSFSAIGSSNAVDFSRPA